MTDDPERIAAGGLASLGAIAQRAVLPGEVTQ
jgi:hypothetical protein